jgi:hypothetical protein
MIDWQKPTCLAFITLALLCGCGDGSNSGNPVSDGSASSQQTDGAPQTDNAAADGSTTGTADDTSNGETIHGPRGDKPLFDGWATPAVALVLTGQQRGYIEPCGCTEGQSGGISRRASLIRELKEKKKWPVTAFDLGGTVRRSRRQSQIKFETLLAAMNDMGYRGLGVGPRELRLGPLYLLSQNVSNEEDPEAGVAFLGANVVLLESPDLGTPIHWRVVTIAGQKIGVTSIIGKSVVDEAFPGGPPQDVSLIDAAKSLEPVLEEFNKQQTSLNVLLAYANMGESQELAKKFPAFHVIVSAGGPEDPGKKPLKFGKSLLLTVGQKGKYAGVVGYYPDDAENPLRYQLVELKKDRFKDDIKMVDHMRFYQDRLKQEELVATELPIKHESGAEFVGTQACAECHTRAYAIWKKTKHARAFEHLKRARKGDPEYGITRIYDAECLACHVTGWNPQEVLRYETGFVNAEFATNDADKLRSKLLQGQQCESCHGPGSRHIELIEDGDIEAAAKMVRVTLKQAEEKTCVKCHDLDNSPNYDFKIYWRKVKHVGTD